MQAPGLGSVVFVDGLLQDCPTARRVVPASLEPAEYQQPLSPPIRNGRSHLVGVRFLLSGVLLWGLSYAGSYFFGCTIRPPYFRKLPYMILSACSGTAQRKDAALPPTGMEGVIDGRASLAIDNGTGVVFCFGVVYCCKGVSCTDIRSSNICNRLRDLPTNCCPFLCKR